MSTTTLMESYDTQMLDSGDIDVSMATESWLLEASMTDDPHDIIPQSHSHQSIEIEMDDHDDEITEYEMADDIGSSRAVDFELLDVDVLDASQVTSPQPTYVDVDGSHLAPEPIPIDMSGAPYISVDPANSAIPQFDLNVAAPVSAPSTLGDESLSTPANDTVGGLMDEQAINPLPSRQELFDSAADSTSTQLANIDAFDIPLPGEENSAILPTASVALPVGSSDVQTPHSYDDAGQELHPESYRKDDQGGQPAESAPTAEEPLPVPTEVAVPALVAPEEQFVVSPLEVESSAHEEAGQDAEHETSDGQEPQTAAVNDGTVPQGDPHEISEGVYIDPPPPVLLSISAAESLECCLFNHPAVTPGAQSPSNGTSSAPTLQLLLHHRPTLYYEPLSAVFDAFRQGQDGLVQNTFDLENGELVLDAYDLQLVMSEDNMYMHEVTLHDLNVLHDGADLSGPLRLELRLVSPRFITRYHALRDQIARLGLTVEEEGSYLQGEKESYHEAEAQNENVDENAEHVEYEAEEETREDVHEQQEEDAEAHEEGAEEHLRHTTEEPQQEYNLLASGESHDGVVEPHGEEDSGERLLHPSAPTYEEQEEDNAQESENQSGQVNPSGAKVEGTLEGPDADEAHQYTDAEGTVDYVDYTEDFEEDDQQFAEYLPEDLGSNAHTSHESRNDLAFEDESAVEVDDTQVLQNYDEGEFTSPLLGPEDIPDVPAHIKSDELDDQRSRTSTGETLDTNAVPVLQEFKETEDLVIENIDEYAETFDEDAEGSIDGSETLSSKSGAQRDQVDSGGIDADAVAEFWLESPALPDSAFSSAEDHGSSRKESPTTFANKSSKRGHDDVDSDDEEGDLHESHADSSDSKRARVQ